MSGDDEQFCRCSTLQKAMKILLFFTVFELIFHLAIVWPMTKLIFEENLVLYLGMMIPLALLTVIRTLLMLYAMDNKLDFFAREKNYYFYILSTLVEWALFAVWMTKYFKT